MFQVVKNEECRFHNLINGEWVDSDSKRYLDIYSPLDGSLVGQVPAMTKDDVDQAINSAKAAQKEWRKTTITERAVVLYKAADLLEEQVEELSNLLIMEIGKDKKSARSEVLRTADFIRFCADSGKNIQGESIPGDSFPGFKNNKVSVVKREPLGVVLAISPFNYPVNLAASKIAPAIIIGNAVVLKPATQGSLCGLYLARIFQEAGVLPGVLNTVTGRGSEIGDYITTHKKIDFINFTGSTEVGKRISKLTQMVPLLMELGGKDAAIVLEDADLNMTAEQIVAGAYSYSGQRCTAVKRIIVMETVADELVNLLKEKIEHLKVGNPLEQEELDVVPLINSASADYVMELIEDAKSQGASLITGGKRKGNLIEPTLFDYVSCNMRIAWEEPFGPVVPVIRVSSMEAAIEIANASEYGLQSSVFTKHIDSAFYIADNLEVGTVQINNKTERGPDHFPFLGVKSSGMGTQGIRYSIESMSRPKATIINIRTQGL